MAYHSPHGNFFSLGAAFLRLLAWIGLGSGLALVGVLVWFNLFFYPAFGLGGLKQEQYQVALLRVGAGFAKSESLTLGDLLWSNFKSYSKASSLAWGSIELFTPKREKIYLWVWLEWSPFWGRWKRRECHLLADPRDQLLFAESLLKMGILEKMAYSLESLYREECRLLREVMAGS